MQALGIQQGVFQARMHVPQAAQLAQCCPAASASAATDAHCSTANLSSSSSRFFSTAGIVNRGRDSSQPWNYGKSNSRGLNVVCMARERRVKMVSQQIKREISAMLLYDKVLQSAVLPETALGADMYLTAVATISDVEVSKDLSVAKVYISIYGDERGQDKAMEQLKNKAGYARKVLAQRMNLKNTPEVRFIKDEALERGSRIIGILDKLKEERELKEKGSNKGEEGEEDNYEDVEDDVDDKDEKEEKSKSAPWSTSNDEGDDSDWDDAENITFIK